tara:strand:+ start:402 stop:599 length:198 start_codon:yes stop_codon:yes gene_type:complete
MKIPTISLKKTLEVTINDALKRLTELDGLDKKALTEKDKDWIQVSEGIKDQPHVFYANQINIEQL